MVSMRLNVNIKIMTKHDSLIINKYINFFLNNKKPGCFLHSKKINPKYFYILKTN